MKCVNIVPNKTANGRVWFLIFDRLDHIEFRQWADQTGSRYKFTTDMTEVILFTETDATLCYLSFR